MRIGCRSGDRGRTRCILDSSSAQKARSPDGTHTVPDVGGVRAKISRPHAANGHIRAIEPPASGDCGDKYESQFSGVQDLGA